MNGRVGCGSGDVIDVRGVEAVADIIWYKMQDEKKISTNSFLSVYFCYPDNNNYYAINILLIFSSYTT